MSGIGLIELSWRREIVASHTVLYKRQQESNHFPIPLISFLEEQGVFYFPA